MTSNISYFNYNVYYSFIKTFVLVDHLSISRLQVYVYPQTYASCILLNTLFNTLQSETITIWLEYILNPHFIQNVMSKLILAVF